MALHRSEEVRQQPCLLTFIALLCVDHCCWYVRMGSHCIETRDQVFTRNMVLELEAFGIALWMLEIKVPTNCLGLGLEILKLIQKMFRFAKEPICRYMPHSGLENDLETVGQCS